MTMSDNDTSDVSFSDNATLCGLKGTKQGWLWSFLAKYLACCEGASVIHCDVYLDDITFKMYLPEKLNFNLFRAGSQT